MKINNNFKNLALGQTFTSTGWSTNGVEGFNYANDGQFIFRMSEKHGLHIEVANPKSIKPKNTKLLFFMTKTYHSSKILAQKTIDFSKIPKEQITEKVMYFLDNLAKKAKK